MTERNDRLWHDVHDVHADRANVKLLANGDIAAIGYVVGINDELFTFRSLKPDGCGYDVRHFFFDDPTLRIER
jgi:hypothetical protein